MVPEKSYFYFNTADNEVKINNPVHYHKNYEVYYLKDGVCRYFIDRKSYKLTAGDIVVIPPGVIHNTVYESNTHTRILLSCSADYIPHSVLKNIKKLVYFGQTPETAKHIETTYKRIQKAVSEPDEFSEDSIRCYLMNLFLIMAKASTDSYEVKTGSPFIEQAVSFIRKNYMNKMTLSQTARHCAVSAEHLSRVFKKETGFGFNEYLNIYRLKKAESLLKSGNVKSISEVAFHCGFNDSNYFSNAYKKMYNITPSQVKKQSETENDYVF